MREFNWCDFEWDAGVFPDPARHAAPPEGARPAYLRVDQPLHRPALAALCRGLASRATSSRRPDGDVWQWDLWQAGMGLVDFTNPEATPLVCRPPAPAAWTWAWIASRPTLASASPPMWSTTTAPTPMRMHNYYTFLYNKTVFDVLEEARGEGEATVFARSATAGGQQFPVHWGGDCIATFESMAESLRGGLSLGLSGFGFWSHDIGGFEQTRPPRSLQALVRLRPALLPQPAARQHLLPRALAVRRGGGGRAAPLHQAQVPPDALPVRRRRPGPQPRARPSCAP